jgi:hypothetical protein
MINATQNDTGYVHNDQKQVEAGKELIYLLQSLLIF